MAPDDVLEDLTHVLDLVERAEHGLDCRRPDLVPAFDELDQLVDDRPRLGHALVVALDRQPVPAQANRATKALAERFEHAVADRGELSSDVVRDRKHLLHGTQCRRGSRPHSP